eukprot:TRINITY_DN67969_c11_g1_i1.p1 TRINITY_DN67969_c11_g1~~TRINITY_DN67969_c11_g1_i1.p1  ORF type:complete len:233 (+),score=10.10 TRINITY_DN67969_c11_g1_i1:24-701(+)
MPQRLKQMVRKVIRRGKHNEESSKDQISSVKDSLDEREAVLQSRLRQYSQDAEDAAKKNDKPKEKASLKLKQQCQQQLSRLRRQKDNLETVHDKLEEGETVTEVAQSFNSQTVQALNSCGPSSVGQVGTTVTANTLKDANRSTAALSTAVDQHDTIPTNATAICDQPTPPQPHIDRADLVNADFLNDTSFGFGFNTNGACVEPVQPPTQNEGMNSSNVEVEVLAV